MRKGRTKRKEKKTHPQGEENGKPRNHILALPINLIWQDANLHRRLALLLMLIQDTFKVSRQTMNDAPSGTHKRQVAMAGIMLVDTAGAVHAAAAVRHVLFCAAVLGGEVVGAGYLNGVHELPGLLEAAVLGNLLRDVGELEEAGHPGDVEGVGVGHDAVGQVGEDARVGDGREVRGIAVGDRDAMRPGDVALDAVEAFGGELVVTEGTQELGDQDVELGDHVGVGGQAGTLPLAHVGLDNGYRVVPLALVAAEEVDVGILVLFQSPELDGGVGGFRGAENAGD